MIRCDAVKPYWEPGEAYCSRAATWTATWNRGQGHVWYCRYHKASRMKDKALKGWKRITST